MNQPKKHADDLIEILAKAIEAQSAPWQKPWKCDARLPTNLITGKVYTRRNLLMLSTVGALAGYNDHRWAGFHQIKSAGGHVRRGEHGHWICIMRDAVRRQKPQDHDDADRTPETNEDLHDPSARERTEAYTYTTFRPVWNAGQCENIAPLEYDEADNAGETTPIAAGEAYLAGTPATVEIGRRDDASYRSRTDEVMLPTPNQFTEPVGFYQTALHELAHATGHRSRLNRRLDENSFGSTTYIHEELVAEMAAFLAGTAGGLGHGPGESASYIAGWLMDADDIRATLRTAVKDATEAATLLAAWQAEGYRRATREAEDQESEGASATTGNQGDLQPAC